MTGIEILSTQEIATEFVFNWTACWITFGVVFGVFLVVGLIVSWYEGDYRNLFVSVILGTLFGVFCSNLFGSVCAESTTYETQYKVTISDEVSMNEFLEKYEIIDQEGKIYTVIERSIEEELQ